MVNPKFSARLGAICSASLRAFNFRNPIFWVMLIFGAYSLIFIQLIETEKIKNRDWNAYQSGLKPRFETQFVPYLATLDEGIVFAKEGSPKFIKKINGLAGKEDWGRWSEQPEVALEFTNPLPEKFILEIRAQGFGPNIGKETKLVVGDFSSTVVLKANPETFNIPIANQNPTNLIKLVPPEPTSPNAINPQNTDLRQLGIGLISVKIKTLNI